MDMVLNKFPKCSKFIGDFEFYEIKYNNTFLYALKSKTKAYQYGSNMYRSDIWWMIKTLFPTVKSRDIVIGWTNIPELFYSSSDSSITTNKVCFEEFSILLEWIHDIVNSSKKKQKLGGLKNGYRSWFTKRKGDLPRTDT